MKILFTGMTARQVGSGRLRYDYRTTSRIYPRLAAELGHEVEVRKIEYGESLASYDLVFVGLAPIGKLNCVHHEEAAWALHAGRRIILYVSDWTACMLGDDWRYRLGPHWGGWVKWKKPARPGALRPRLQQIVYGKCPWPLMAPMWPWGDHSRLTEGNIDAELIPIDVTSAAGPSPVSTSKVGDRTLQWIFAHLQQSDDSWLPKLTWPVFSCGNKRLGEPVLPEAKVLQHYADSWGVISPRYGDAGSGWFRFRYPFALSRGAIVLTNPKEAESMGPAFQIPSYIVEAMNIQELRKLADRQREEFYSRVWNREKLMKTFKRVLKEAGAPGSRR